MNTQTMSWSDDDWEGGDVDKKLEETQAKKAKDWDSSSDEEKKPPEEEKKPEPKPEPKPKASGKKGKKKFSKFDMGGAEEKQEPADVPLADPVAEKRRKQKLVEEADQRLAADLFGDCPKPKAEVPKNEAKSSKATSSDLPPKIQYVTKDSFDELELKVQKDVEALTSRCCNKITSSTTLKAGAAHKFVYDLFKALEPDLSSQELTELEKFVSGIMKDKKVQKTAQAENKKKGNEKMSKTGKGNYADEMAIVYGGGDDWDEEDWDGYEDY